MPLLSRHVHDHVHRCGCVRRCHLHKHVPDQGSTFHALCQPQPRLPTAWEISHHRWNKSRFGKVHVHLSIPHALIKARLVQFATISCWKLRWDLTQLCSFTLFFVISQQSSSEHAVLSQSPLRKCMCSPGKRAVPCTVRKFKSPW